jgi:hypothetical protein
MAPKPPDLQAKFKSVPRGPGLAAAVGKPRKDLIGEIDIIYA